VTCFAAFELS